VRREEKTKRLILDALQKNRDGLTISDVSRLLGLHYTTASKYLAVLEAMNLVTRRDIGMAKVFKMVEK
jgi:DNA-binding IclR family transcriptional regulator